MHSSLGQPATTNNSIMMASGMGLGSILRWKGNEKVLVCSLPTSHTRQLRSCSVCSVLLRNIVELFLSKSLDTTGRPNIQSLGFFLAPSSVRHHTSINISPPCRSNSLYRLPRRFPSQATKRRLREPQIGSYSALTVPETSSRATPAIPTS